MEGGLIPTNSEGSSDLTVDNSLHQDGSATSELSQSDWTDEKHSLYLDSLEASFVNQLHYSLGLLASRSILNSSGKLPNSSDQFTVVRDGCWQKLKFDRNRTDQDSYAILKNPWVCHFRSVGKFHTVASVAEVSGQNFEDEEQGHKAKKLKTDVVADGSTKDQVVPFGRFQDQTWISS